MRACVVSPGVAHSVPRTVAIAEHFDEVHFIDFAGTADEQLLKESGVKYYLYGEGGKIRKSGINLQHLITKIDPDIIICHFCSGDHFFHATASGRAPVCSIAMGHDVLYDKGDKHNPMLRRLLVRMGLRQAAFIAAKSRQLMKRIRSYGVTGPVQLNYWGCDIHQFAPGERAGVRFGLDLPADRPIVLSARAIEPRLNIGLIVESLSVVREKIPNVLLVVIGRSDPAELARIHELIEQRGLADSVIILGNKSQSDLARFYQAADVIVSMASSDGFPNTVLEAMSCRVPVVIGEIPEIRELLTDGINARICRFDSKAIGESILDILENPNFAEEIAENARQTVLEVGNIWANGKMFADEVKRSLDVNRSGHAFNLYLFRFVFFVYLVSRRFLK